MIRPTEYKREFAGWSDFCRDHLMGEGSLPPMWQITADDGMRYVLLTPWANQDEKEMAVAFIRAVMAGVQAEAWMFASEAWLANHDPALAELRPSERSDRHEVLVLHAGHRKHQRIDLMQAFGRDADGGVVLEPPLAGAVASSSWIFDHLFEWNDLSQEARDAAVAILSRNGQAAGRAH